LEEKEMKTIIENTTNISKYIFEDDASVTIGSDSTATPDSVIADMNSSNCTMVTGVTPPEDWTGNKYTYSEGAWSANSDYEELPAEPDWEALRVASLT
jgi:hypothetical protein